MNISDQSGLRRALILASVLAAGGALAAGGTLQAEQQGTAQAQNYDNVQIDVLPVRGGVYMLVGAGGNTTIQVGSEGVMLVDTQFGPLSTRIINAIKSISPEPIRYVVNTHVHADHIGGNEAIAAAGRTRAGGNVVGDIGAAATDTARIIAHENVLNRMVKGQPPVPRASWPTETFFTRKKELLFNDEAVQILHEDDRTDEGPFVDGIPVMRRDALVARRR